MSAALDFTYQYAFPSGLQNKPKGKPTFSLATSNPEQASPYFFDGQVKSPRIMGDMLLTLSDVVRTHFFLPRPVLLDPVLTSNENLLRLEGFSGCCGVYARVDLPAEAFDGECHQRGTTNVDFNTPMRNALLRLRDNEDVQFSVGKDAVVLSREGEKTIEKKVKLPLRWIKGFSEVQSYQTGLDLNMECSATDALRFVRSLPNTAQPKMPSFVVSAGRSLRLSQRAQKGAVQIWGTHRVKVIEALLPRAKSLRVWAHQDNGISAWEVCFASGSFFLMISPEVYRGFSGEGQLLSDLATPPSESLISKVKTQLKWQSEINIDYISDQLDLNHSQVSAVLAVLSSRGLVGFDAAQQHYFHRELPFDLSTVEDMQPRLKNARKLLQNKIIKRVSAVGVNPAVYQIPGTDIEHRVELSELGDRCTCPWYSKYLGKRGPCKHILAAQLFHDASTEHS